MVRPASTSAVSEAGKARRALALLRRRWWVVVIGLVAMVVADYLLYPRLAGVGGRSFNTGGNGLWLRYTWYFGEKGEDQARELAQMLRRRQIRYAYFHVRYIEADGTLRFRYAESGRGLVEAVHRAAPEVEVIAWVYAGNERGQGEVNLADEQVRKAMVGEAVWLVEECGFDGVQWDYEVCPDGDQGFLALMRETREALPEGKLLCTALPPLRAGPLRRWGWSGDYLAQVAGTCDQVAVMCYDTGHYLPRSYVWFVRRQAVGVTRAVGRGNRDCRVLLGVPTYGDAGSFRSHHARAEDIRLALKGVREGLSRRGADLGVFAGVAPFADYTTDEDEWRTYEELWLTAPPNGGETGRSPARPLAAPSP